MEKIEHASSRPKISELLNRVDEQSFVEASTIEAYAPKGLEPPVPAADDVSAYESLTKVLALARQQAASGKGKERHANGKPFVKQPILEIGRMMGLGGHSYQISKKAQEAVGMVARSEFDKAKAELLGVIVYACAGYILVEEFESGETPMVK